VEFQYFRVFFRNRAERREDYLSGLGAAGEEKLVFGVKEAKGGKLEVRGGFDGLV
jgi:hypothetical protein